MELLSPVKDLMAAKIVIGAGADAIYFASPSFGARTKAAIDVEEAKELVSYANDNQVKTYAAFNTVVFDDELEQFWNELDELYMAGISGVIIQDIAFINLIKMYYPELEVHASTQMHIHNTAAASLIKTEGSNRVVVPREMNYERIKKIKDNTDLEIEAFVHGALCVSYSGQCYDSTLLDQKSANRGRCSQYCRMPQHTVFGPTGKVVSSGDYPLNLKDQNNLENLKLYEEAGVDSLKIEGRLKSIDYAYHTTKSYRDALDNGEMSDLTEVYNREFTDGRINGTNGRSLVNLYRPNNSGKRIGKVARVEANKAKSLQYYPYVISVDLKPGITLNIQDNLRYTGEDFEDGQNLEQFKMVTPTTALVFSKVKPEVGDFVHRTLNASIVEQAKAAATVTRRREVSINIFLKNQVLWYSVEKNPPVNSGITFEKATNKPTTKEDILEKLGKTKNTPYDLVVNDFRYDGDRFCQISKINQMKKDIVAFLQDQDNQLMYSNVVDSPAKELIGTEDETSYYVEVQTVEQYETVQEEMSSAYILIGTPELANEIEPTDKDYFVTPSVIYDDEMDEILAICDRFENIVASETGIFTKLDSKKNVITNYTFNTTNYINQKKLVELGASKTLLSIELNEEKLSTFGNDNSIVNIYGRIPVMMMDYCPINMNKTDDCGSCVRCRNGEYFLEDKLGREFPLMYAGNHRIAMLSRKPISLVSKQDELEDMGINNFYIRFTDETESEVEEVLDCVNVGINDISFPTNTGSYHKTTL